MTAWYNENDPKAAAWLRELIRHGHIADGVVDERSIEDVTPNDLRGFAQCHFFAGIGVWSYSLRRAGWSDDRPVWTGSCPCQPLSQAGKGLGFADERHLWPAWEHLIRELRPTVLFGEQVASKAADSWADLVQDDLEALDYAFGAVPFPAASVGAPHIRDRLYWMAHHHHHTGREQYSQRDGEPQGGLEERSLWNDAGGRGKLGDASSSRGRRNTGTVSRTESRAEREVRSQPNQFELASAAGDLADSSSTRLEILSEQQARGQRETAERSGASNFWDPYELLWCRDGKWRPVEPGTFPLAHGAPARVGRLRGYGNAIVSEAAKVFVEATGLVD